MNNNKVNRNYKGIKIIVNDDKKVKNKAMEKQKIKYKNCRNQ